MGCGASISGAGAPSSAPYDSIADEAKSAAAGAGTRPSPAHQRDPKPSSQQQQRHGASTSAAEGPPPRPSRNSSGHTREASMDADVRAVSTALSGVGQQQPIAAGKVPHATHAAVLQLQVANLSRTSATNSSSASTPMPIQSDSPAVHARAGAHAKGSLLAPLKPVATPNAVAALTAAAAAAAAGRTASETAAAAGAAAAEAARATAGAAAEGERGALTSERSDPYTESAALTASGVLVASTPDGLPTLGPSQVTHRSTQDAATSTSYSLENPALQRPPQAPPSAALETPSSLGGTFCSDADDVDDPAAMSLRASAHVHLHHVPSQAAAPGGGAAGRYGGNQTDDEDGDTPAAAKLRFDLAQWRSFYVFNKQNHAQLLEYLWRRFDPASHSILAATYKGQDNITVGYQGENVIHGFCCRLEGCGLEMFGLLHTLAGTNAASGFKVLGVFITQGPDIPEQLSSTLDDEHFQLLKADTNDPLVRQFVGQLLTNTSPMPDFRITSSRML